MKTRRFKINRGGHEIWVTRQGKTTREVQKQRDRESRAVIDGLFTAGGKKKLVRSTSPATVRKRQPDYALAEKQLEAEMGLPQKNAIGGMMMDGFDRKIIDAFPGKAVRKDLTGLMKKGANVPTYVLEYLLGMYCTTDDEEALKIGLEKIKKILSENYVRPDQSEYVKSKIKENRQYTIIDKITVELDEREDKYVARFTNLKISPFEVSADFVVHNEKLLNEKLYGERQLRTRQRFHKFRRFDSF